LKPGKVQIPHKHNHATLAGMVVNRNLCKARSLIAVIHGNYQAPLRNMRTRNVQHRIEARDDIRLCNEIPPVQG
jgi:tRNA A22 N-methylase